MYLYPPNPQWPERFQQEHYALVNASHLPLQLTHIGSTALPGLWSKNVVDILGQTAHLSEVATLATALKILGYEYRGEHGIAGRQYFVKTHPYKVHLHIHSEEDANAEKHLHFLAVMRAHPHKIAELNQLKRQLHAKYPTDKTRYQNEKAFFYAEILQMKNT